MVGWLIGRHDAAREGVGGCSEKREERREDDIGKSGCVVMCVYVVGRHFLPVWFHLQDWDSVPLPPIHSSIVIVVVHESILQYRGYGPNGWVKEWRSDS